MSAPVTPQSAAEPWRWRVEAQSGKSGWATQVDRLNREVAGLTAETYAVIHPEWSLRLVHEATAEIVHLDQHGKPMPLCELCGRPRAEHDTTVMRRDVRSPEEVLADLAADRYEASLERSVHDA